MEEKQQIRVLIVEDNAMVGEMTRGILRKLGYAVVGRATDGEHALRMMSELVDTPDRPDVILMDVQMPGMNGIEASRQVQVRFPTPVVILTAYDQIDLVEQASAAGVGAYLIKPPNLNDLERAITIAIARFEDMRALRQLNAQLHDEIVERTRAQEALDRSNRELRVRHQRETLLAHAVSQFNAAESIDQVVNTVAAMIRDMSYAYLGLWERRDERLFWRFDEAGAPAWLMQGLKRILGDRFPLQIWTPVDGDSILAQCYREKAILTTQRGQDLLDELYVENVPLRALPASAHEIARQLLSQLDATEHHIYPLGEYGLLVLSGTRPSRTPAHRAWVQLIVAQAATAIERQQLIAQLRSALAQVRTLSGLLPICASCKKIRDDSGYWHQVEEYIQSHSQAAFSHSLCPECAHELYPEYFDQDGKLRDEGSDQG